MKVFIVEGGWDYEGFEIIGIYSDELKAKEVIESWDGYGYDYMIVEEQEIL